MPKKNSQKSTSLQVKVITPTKMRIINRQLVHLTGGMLISSFLMASLLTYFSAQ